MIHVKQTNMIEKKYVGFIAPKIQPEHYVMGQGNVPFQVLKPDGDWTLDLPIGELQAKNGFETFNCTGFNTSKQITEYLFNAFNDDTNYSERWIGIIAGTDPETEGNDPQKVYEAIRKYGLIPEELLPFSADIKDVADYYSFKGGNKEVCYAAGRAWLAKYVFYHEWVFDPESKITSEEKLHNMQVAIKYSPLSFGVYAWAMDGRGFYIKLGSENHWTNAYKIDQFLDCFDSYEPFNKIVDQDIVFCKRIHIDKRVPQKSYFTSLLEKLYLAIKKHVGKSTTVSARVN